MTSLPSTSASMSRRPFPWARASLGLLAAIMAGLLVLDDLAGWWEPESDVPASPLKPVASFPLFQALEPPTQEHLQDLVERRTHWVLTHWASDGQDPEAWRSRESILAGAAVAATTTLWRHSDIQTWAEDDNAEWMAHRRWVYGDQNAGKWVSKVPGVGPPGPVAADWELVNEADGPWVQWLSQSPSWRGFPRPVRDAEIPTELREAVMDSGLAGLVIPPGATPDDMQALAHDVRTMHDRLQQATGWSGGVLGLHGRVVLWLQPAKSTGREAYVWTSSRGIIHLTGNMANLPHEWFHALDIALARDALVFPQRQQPLSAQTAPWRAQQGEGLAAMASLHQQWVRTPLSPERQSAWRVQFVQAQQRPLLDNGDTEYQDDIRFLETRFLARQDAGVAPAFSPAWLARMELGQLGGEAPWLGRLMPWSRGLGWTVQAWSSRHLRGAEGEALYFMRPSEILAEGFSQTLEQHWPREETLLWPDYSPIFQMMPAELDDKAEVFPTFFGKLDDWWAQDATRH